MEAQVGQSLAAVDPKTLGEARTQAQNAAHWLARVANSYRDPEPQQRHLWLGFDIGRKALVTKTFADDVSVELRLPTLEMQFREGGRPVPHTLAVEGHSPAKVEAWMLVELLHRGIDRDRFSKSLPYTPSNMMTGDNVEYSPEACARELDALTAWLDHASEVLGRLTREFQPTDAGEGILTCWPEQFHIGFLSGLNPGEEISDQALRVAFSAGDDRYAEPYFFVAVQKDGELATPHPGAVLTASRIVAEKMGPDAIAEALRSAVSTTRRRLSN